MHGVGAGAGSAETWAKGLAGLSPQQIAAGIETCIASALAWPPELPTFRAMCLGIPSFDVVDSEITAPGSTKTAFARLVWSKVADPYGYGNANGSKQERMRRAAYDLAVEHVMRGGELPAEPVAVITQKAPKPQGIPVSAESRSRHLQALPGELYSPRTAAVEDGI